MNHSLKILNNLYKMNDKHADNTYNILSVSELLNRKLDLSLLITKESLCHFSSINANVDSSDINDTVNIKQFVHHVYEKWMKQLSVISFWTIILKAHVWCLAVTILIFFKLLCY